MAAQTPLSITSLMTYFTDEYKSISRGENHYKSGHVESMIYKDGILRGHVHASMKNRVYKVEINTDANHNIVTTKCECPRGEFKCSHAAALFIHGIHNISCTDVECSWKKKKEPKNATIQSAAEMYPSPRPQYTGLTQLPTDDDRQSFYDDLKQYGHFTGIAWLLSPDKTAHVELPIQTLAQIMESSSFMCLPTTGNKVEYIRRSMTVPQESIGTIAAMTVNQRDEPMWHLLRKGRLTASNFGSVLGANKVTASLKKRLLGEYDLSRVKAVQWGIVNEPEAAKAFTNITGLTIIKTGLWLDTTGAIGASPDGFVGESHVLELKCPFSLKDCTIEESLSTKDFCLEKNGDCLSLKPSHVYWHQVQGQMFLTNRPFCYFVVWTLKDACVINVQRDPLYINNINKLRNFYYSCILPYIIDGEIH